MSARTCCCSSTGPSAPPTERSAQQVGDRADARRDGALADIAETQDELWWRRRTLGARQAHPVRSEEHTSELQSRRDLVCRLLLEKKKQSPYRANNPTIQEAPI